jgi:cell wall assembly regulator SMI1
VSTVSEFLDWVKSNAPRTWETIRPSAGVSEREAAESRYGVTFPDDLRDLYECADGQDQATRHAAGALMPFGFLYSLEEAAVISLLLREALGTSPESLAAESIFEGFPERCVPIGGLDADHVVVDLRPGQRSGSVFLWDKVDRNFDSYWWPSVSAFFADLAAATKNGTPIMTCVPAVDDGILDWEWTEEMDDGLVMTHEVMPESFEPTDTDELGFMTTEREPIYDAKGNLLGWGSSEPEIVGYIDEKGNEVSLTEEGDQAPRMDALHDRGTSGERPSWLPSPQENPLRIFGPNGELLLTVDGGDPTEVVDEGDQ